MASHLASAIVRQFGPCRLALDAEDGAALATELSLLGCDPASDRADVIVLDWRPHDTTATLLHRLSTAGTARGLVLLSGQDLGADEAVLFAAGWQRHPGPRHAQLAFYARADHARSGLLTRNDDEAEAATARWAMVAQQIRAGDAVLLVGPDAADGAAIVTAQSRAGSVESAAALPDDQSFDFIAVLAVATDWRETLDTCARLLKRDGRLVVGWPEAAGPRDWATLHEALAGPFLIDSRFTQSGSALPARAVEQSFPSPGWLIALVSANPFGAEPAAYVHPAFGHASTISTDFGAAYDNPWLYRTLVQIGERIGDSDTLLRLAQYVIESARDGSADKGAAITVLGYRILEERAAEFVPILIELIEAFRDQSGDAPHELRWRLSLAYLAGRLSEMAVDRPAARHWYEQALAEDWRRFAPILATKTIGAAFFLGRLALADGNKESARTAFARGVETALQAAACDHRAELGDADRPLPFYLPELAEVIDMGSQCANALTHLHLYDRDPGQFWRQVDVKRFGLATWASDLSRENDRLRALLAEAERTPPHRSIAA